MTTIEVNPAVALCVERAQQHQVLAADASTDEERRAHEATMRALDKAAMEIVKGNTPRYAGSGLWLVESRTQANVVYRVDLTTQMCSCKNAKSCWHLSAANVCEELRSLPADQVLPAQSMPDREIVSELDAMAGYYDAEAMQAAMDADDMTMVSLLEATATQNEVPDVPDEHYYVTTYKEYLTFGQLDDGKPSERYCVRRRGWHGQIICGYMGFDGEAGRVEAQAIADVLNGQSSQMAELSDLNCVPHMRYECDDPEPTHDGWHLYWRGRLIAHVKDAAVRDDLTTKWTTQFLPF